jgi:hypothetical protein
MCYRKKKYLKIQHLSSHLIIVFDRIRHHSDDDDGGSSMEEGVVHVKGGMVVDIVFALEKRRW